jgi:hypothetical protein
MVGVYPFGVMIVDEDIERFLLHSGFTEPSLEAVRPYFPRWKRWIHSLGVTRIAPLLSPSGPTDDHAANLLILLAKQASLQRDQASEHHLRNLTGIRPYKP